MTGTFNQQHVKNVNLVDTVEKIITRTLKHRSINNIFHPKYENTADIAAK